MSDSPTPADATESTAVAPADTAAANADDDVVRPPAGDTAALEAAIVEAIQTIYDPEIPVNIYELGLIYDVDVGAEAAEGNGREVYVKMTLTSPACPVAGSLPGEVEGKVASVDGVGKAEVDLVWDPVWNPSMMSEEARLELGMM
ncbi:MAG: DUF59 domain-containing protein [Acidobacteriota bacterium]